MSDGYRQHRYLIIGNGAAGFAAAEAIRQCDPDGTITIVSDEKAPFYSRPGLAYLLNGTVPEKQLYPYSTEALRQLNLQRIHGWARTIQPHRHLVTLDSGQELYYDRLLLATGARAIRPNLPGIDLEGVVTLDTLNDARRILKLSTRARRAVVIGGGITALELAEGLTARGVSTHYLMRKDHFYRKVLEQIESEMVEQALVERGIKLHRRAQIREVRGRRGKVSGVITDQGDTIKCQLLAVAVGIRPNLELAHAANLQVDRGILVDEAMQTSVGDIFAAGDAAQVFDPLTGDWKMDSLWWMAQEQGRVAGENMVGGGRTFTRSTPFNVTCLGGIVTTIIGTVGQGKEDPDLITIVHGDSESWRDQLDSFVVVSGDKRDHVRIVLDREKVIGAVVMGDQTLSRPLQDIIQRQVRLGRFRHLLMREPRKALELLVKSYGKRRADLWTEAA